MKKKSISFNQILEESKSSTANSFQNFLNENNIDYSLLDSDNIMDPNEGNYNIHISDYNTAILFFNGEFADYSSEATAG